MEITGKIKVVCPAKSGVSQKSGNEWKSQDYVIETSGEHPESCVFSVFGSEKINEFNLRVGETVSVSLNIEAREYNGRWFNSLRAWRVMKPNAQNQQQAYAPAQAQAAPTVRETRVVQVEEISDDNLPF